MEDKIITSDNITKIAVATYHETGLYRNVYKDKSNWGVVVVSNDYYTSPEHARKHIKWDTPNIEYLFTAKWTSEVHKFEKP